jgi:hypothetical protein
MATEGNEMIKRRTGLFRRYQTDSRTTARSVRWVSRMLIVAAAEGTTTSPVLASSVSPGGEHYDVQSQGNREQYAVLHAPVGYEQAH